MTIASIRGVIARAEERKSQTVEIAISSDTRTWALEVQDAEEVRRVPIGARAVVFGSSPVADVLVRDRTVSSKHCEISVVGRGVAVRDLGSTNGTFVGGARVREALGTEGTTIAIGQTTLVCVALDDDDEDELGEPLPGVAGSSRAMRRVASQVRRLARLSSPVLIAGETGVGKELVARALHTEGPRAPDAFVAMNVAALPRELVESELFGHERGAFTGAVARRVGAFTEAEGGTLFLDEIGELPIDAQPKLLRALDGYEVRRVGAAGSGRKATARVVVATHVPLQENVRRGTFRRDLFHRLEVFVVDVPPLRERPGDVLPIARLLLSQLESEIGKRELTPAAIAQLAAHDWPGNVRELRNVLCRAADLARSARWLDAAVVDRALRRPKRTVVELTPETAKESLARHGGNISAAARATGVARTTFRKLIGETLRGPKKA
ncbi:MAG TPA: sigma 54-interacting transcriptional regulator [Labilithrix sp.]|nr:sigma 54-interacting transcriptional regulator [Labilithrix sp.]